MAISQWTTRLASMLAVLVMTTAAFAQHHGPAQPYHPQMHTPFIDPMAFDPDYQFFAPAELGTFGNGWKAKTGWFGKYDRMHLFMTRPELEPSYNGMDSSWGHRVAMGYMTTDDHGWTFEGFNFSGPGNFDELLIERSDRVNDDDTDTNNGGGGGGGGGNQGDDPVIPVGDRNDPETGSRIFRSLRSINVASLNGFELNKTFRLKQFHNGSYLEPILGVRYQVFNDFHRRDTYGRIDPTTGIPDPMDPTNNTQEQIAIFRSNWENHMVGAHLGVHWFTRRPHWQLSSDLKVFATQNFQSLNQSTDSFDTFYSTVGEGADIDTTAVSRTLAWTHNDEFVWGLDVRAEAAYELTRDISLTCGVQVLHYVQGIARGNQADFNEEDLTLVGATFGFQVNR